MDTLVLVLAFLVVLLLLLTPLNADGTCAVEFLANKVSQSPDDAHKFNGRMPYGGRRTLLEIGRERYPYGDEVFPGPLYSWGRQVASVGYGPLIIPNPDIARITGAEVRSVNNAELEDKLAGL